MQYAEVAIDSKTSLARQVFTYAISPELLPDIKQGILVLVPFHGRKLYGVVLSLKHINVGTFKQNIKPIIKIIDTTPVLDSIRLHLAKWLSEYYLSLIGKVIFMMIPPTAFKQLKNLQNQQLLLKSAYADFNNKNIKLSGKIYTFYGHINKRERVYFELIKKALVKKRNCLVLFPSIDQAENFQQRLRGSQNNIPTSEVNEASTSEVDKIKSVLYHSEMTKTQRYMVWDNIRKGKYQVVIGTRPTVFAPLNKIGLIIIDQPENFGYKEEQNLRYHSNKVGQRLAQLYGANLVLGSLTPSVESYYLEKLSKYKKLSSYKLQVTSCRLIDLSQQKNKIISWELEQSIKSTLENNGKILLFCQRKGEGSSLVCQDCGYVFKCDKCKLPFALITDYKLQITDLKCHRCNITKSVTKFCPICRGIKLKTYGVGTDTIKKELNKLFPQIKVEIMEKDNIPDTKCMIADSKIVIATKKILDFTGLEFDLVAVINMDNLLNLPDYSIRENIYITIVNLINLVKSTFILQTYNAENYFWDFLRSKNAKFFLAKELLDRKKYAFPPFSHIIKLTYQNEDEKKCQEEVEDLRLQIINYKLQIIGPNPAFIAKIRGKFQYQMIVFIKSAQEKNQFKKVIAKLPKGWKIDVDPISLL